MTYDMCIVCSYDAVYTEGYPATYSNSATMKDITTTDVHFLPTTGLPSDRRSISSIEKLFRSNIFDINFE